MIAFFGGTFDPVHLGHLHAARTVASLFVCESMHLVLSAHPPLRNQPVAPLQDRWQMLVLACEDVRGLVADDRELRRDRRPSYTVDTLEEIRAELGHIVSICWCIGTDQLRALPPWRNPKRILELAHLVVLARAGDRDVEHQAALDSLVAGRVTNDPTKLSRSRAGSVYFCDAPMLPISATMVRAMVLRSESVARLLPPKVATYITQHQLYGGSGYR